MQYAIINYTEAFSGKMGKNVKTRFSVKDVRSTHTPSTNNAQNSSVSLWEIVRGIYGYGRFTHACLAAKGEKGYAELTDANGITTISVVDGSKALAMKLSAAEINDQGVLIDYPQTRKGSVFTAAYMAYQYGKDGEIQRLLADLQEYTAYEPDADIWDDPMECEKFGKLLNTLSQNIYYTAKEEHSLTSFNGEKLRQAGIKSMDGCSILFGKTDRFTPKEKSSEEALKPGQFLLDDKRKLTDEEIRMIPKMPSSYVSPKWVLSIAEEIKESSIFSEPVRNILLSGPAGTGKTTGAMAIAYALGLPYVKITCSPDTDMFDIVGQMLPNTEKTELSSLFQQRGIPTFEDVEMNPQETFKTLFGREMTKYDTAADCYSKIVNLLMDGMEQTKDFTYVESNFIKAIENGWVIELQEPNVIKRNSVMVGLNSIMENDSHVASITLPTGRTIHRHPDAVVIVTTNSEYDGCGRIQESVLSRMQTKRSIENPLKEELAERTIKQTGFKNRVQAEKMADTILSIAKYCKDKGIEGGVCGPRELQNWAKKAMLLQKKENGNFDTVTEDVIIRAAFPTMIAKSAQTEEEVEEIITAVFGKKYDQMVVQEAKEAYLAGEI